MKWIGETVRRGTDEKYQYYYHSLETEERNVASLVEWVSPVPSCWVSECGHTNMMWRVAAANFQPLPESITTVEDAKAYVLAVARMS